MPSDNEIEHLVGETITKTILSRQLGAVNITQLKEEGGLEILMKFVRESFKSTWNGKNLSAIKSLDTMTKDLQIPSRSGKDIANLSKVSYYILFINSLLTN